MDWAWTSSPLWLLCTHLALLSASSLGGGMLTVMPDVHRFVVETHHWVTSEQFASAFAMAQASPGPNFLYVSIIGWQIAGWPGAILTSVAVVVPPALICYAVIHIGAGSRNVGSGPLRKALREGLIPLSAGLMLATGWVLASTVDQNWRAALMTLIFVVILMRTRVHPLWLIVLGALAGMLGLV